MIAGEEILKGVVYTPEKDQEISREVMSALKANWQMTEENVKVTVVEGSVTLEGSSPWNYQKASAEQIISALKDVKSVTNKLVIQPGGRDSINKMEIENAMKRNWTIGHSGIHVCVSGDQVTLNGTVQSVHELDEAEKIAGIPAGIDSVINKLQIIPANP